MRSLIFPILFVLFLGCGTSVQIEDIAYLNGYWEISEVEFPSGQTKEYAISTTIDYMELNGMKGFRKKVQPQLDGSYQTSDDAENFEINEQDGVVRIFYGQGTQQREETLMELGENSFSVRNMEEKIYRYKRYEPINLAP